MKHLAPSSFPQSCPFIWGRPNGHRWLYAIFLCRPPTFFPVQPCILCLFSQHLSTLSVVIVFVFFHYIYGVHLVSVKHCSAGILQWSSSTMLKPCTSIHWKSLLFATPTPPCTMFTPFWSSLSVSPHACTPTSSFHVHQISPPLVTHVSSRYIIVGLLFHTLSLYFSQKCIRNSVILHIHISDIGKCTWKHILIG